MAPGSVALPGTDAMGWLTNLADLERGGAEAQRAAAAPGTPIVTHSFEFRLSGSEGMEQSLALDLAKIPRAGLILAIRSVRTYLTRQGEPMAAASAIATQTLEDRYPSAAVPRIALAAARKAALAARTASTTCNRRANPVRKPVRTSSERTRTSRGITDLYRLA